MPRVNVDFEWWGDSRREALAQLVGDRLKADGIMLLAWKMSQEFWARDRKLVPLTLFKTIPFWEHIVGVGLAQLEGQTGPEFVYVAGTREKHEWRMQRIQASKAGGLKTKENFEAKRRLNTNSRPSQTGAKTRPSSSTSSSSSSINTNTYAQFAARLERVYEKFPRKEGKSRGLEKLRKVKESDLPLVEKAVENYAEHCRLNRTEPQYLKHFSTWATEWRDWVDFKPKVLAAKLEAETKAEEQRRRSEQLDKEIFGDGF